MNIDDKRHGSYAGYVAKCRCDDCREAARRYQAGLKWDLHNGRTRSIDSTVSRRQLQALAALGWDFARIAKILDVSPQVIHRWANSERVYRRTAVTIAEIYERLSMTLPPTATPAERTAASRIRAIARRKGYAPPLAWTCIEDPNERPRGMVYPAPSGVQCGTDGGYQRHRRIGEIVCAPCQDAHRDRRRADRSRARNEAA